jgi:N-acetyl-anhydromuramyl-L-alanine amidase AmpD
MGLDLKPNKWLALACAGLGALCALYGTNAEPQPRRQKTGQALTVTDKRPAAELCDIVAHNKKPEADKPAQQEHFNPESEIHRQLLPQDCYRQGRKERIKHIVLHSTEGNTARGAIEWLNCRKNSYHYIIDRDGKITQLVNDADTAYHAGKYANPIALGIALTGWANKPGAEFTQKQYAALATLLTHLQKKHCLKPDDIVTHGYITTTYGGTSHTDPEPAFRWEKLKELMK